MAIEGYMEGPDQDIPERELELIEENQQLEAILEDTQKHLAYMSKRLNQFLIGPQSDENNPLEA